MYRGTVVTSVRKVKAIVQQVCSHVETHKYEYTNTQIHEAVQHQLQPDRKKCADEGLESAREEVGDVTVAQVHADGHPNNYCLWW